MLEIKGGCTLTFRLLDLIHLQKLVSRFVTFAFFMLRRLCPENHYRHKKSEVKQGVTVEKGTYEEAMAVLEVL